MKKGRSLGGATLAVLLLALLVLYALRFMLPAPAPEQAAAEPSPLPQETAPPPTAAPVPTAEPTPQPTPEPTREPAPVGVPEIAVSGYLSEDNGVYVVTDTGAAVSWTAEGAAGYDVTIYDYNGDVAKSVKDTTQTTLNVTCDGMTDGDVFTIQVTGKAADGASGESASVQLRYAAPEVTPEPAPEIGLAEIQVQGYTDFDGETYFYGDDGLTLSWSAANAETYDLAVLDASGNVVNSVSATTQTSLSVSAQAANAGQAERNYRWRGTVRVATKYPRITQQYYDRIGQQVDILTLHGNIELGPIVGMTDRIVDITATGTTLRENDLVIVDDVMECTARFFAGPAAYRCDKRIRDLAARLAEVSATTKEA